MKKQNLFFIGSLLAIAFALSSCAALTRYKCNREYAGKKGMEDASKGLASQPAKLEGTSCTAEYTESNYVSDYLKGFEQKKNEICQPTNAASLGLSDGQQGLVNKPERQKINLCSDRKDFKKIDAAYENAFSRAFCSTDRAAKVGQAQAEGSLSGDFESQFVACKQKKQLRNSYMNAYKKTLEGFCTESNAKNLGASLASQKKTSSEGLVLFSRCNDISKSDLGLKAKFEQSYNETKAALDKAEADRIAQAQEQARQARIANFQRTTAVTAFTLNQRNYVSRCNVAADRSFVQVEVENSYPDQVLIQGDWKVHYYNTDFAKITEDKTQEAVLITGNNKKTFQKLTLPKDAAFCRAEYTGRPLPLVR